MACVKLPFNGGTIIVCGVRVRRCAFCKNECVRLCDHPVIRKGKRADCNKPLCVRHSRQVQMPVVDLCPAHATLYELNGNQFQIDAVSLDPVAASLKPTRKTDSKCLYNVFRRGKGWLSPRGSNGERCWIQDQTKAEAFSGGPELDRSLRAYKLEAYASAALPLFQEVI